MKAAYTGWTWLTAKDAETAKKQLEQSFKECKFLGYDYVENFAFIGDYFEDPNELIEMEKRCGVELVNLYGHFGTDVEENIKVRAKSRSIFSQPSAASGTTASTAGISVTAVRWSARQTPRCSIKSAPLRTRSVLTQRKRA